MNIAEARLGVLGAILDLAAFERDDSLTLIDERSEELAAPLRPTLEEWAAVEATHAPYFASLYPDQFDPAITLEAFVAGYCERSGITPARLLELGREARRCYCAEDGCEGWRMASTSEESSR